MQPQALITAEPIKAAAATARAVSTHGRTLPQEPTKTCVQSPQQASAGMGTSAWSACFRTKREDGAALNLTRVWRLYTCVLTCLCAEQSAHLLAFLFYRQAHSCRH